MIILTHIHNMVIMVINWSQVHKKKNRGNKDKKIKIDTQKLVHCSEIKTKLEIIEERKIRRKIKQSRR